MPPDFLIPTRLYGQAFGHWHWMALAGLQNSVHAYAFPAIYI
jgi:hypothetical protein